MPKPGKNESQKDFVSRCIPIVLDEGTAKDQKQAAAICYSLWREAKKETDMDEIKEATGVWAWVKSIFSPKEKLTKTNTFVVWKEANGYRWLAAYSNKFRDDDNPPEILSESSHKEFVEVVDKGEWPYPELWLWHVKGSRSGAADFVAYDGAFALASGMFDADKSEVAEKLSGRDDLFTSHGMPVSEIQRDKEDGTIITRYRTVEISVLPDWAAANKHTPFTIVKEVDMALPEPKRAFLVDILGEEKAAELERQLEDKGKELEQKVEFKEEKKEEGGLGAPVTELTPEPVKWVTADEVVEAVAGNLKPILEQLETLRLTVENLGKEVKEYKASEDEKLKHLVAETPAASLFSQIQSAIGAKETEIDGRSSLAKSGPKEVNTSQEGPALVGIVNEYMKRQHGG